MGANFYLSPEISSETRIGAYLTYGCYLVLGMLVGWLFCDDHPDESRARRSSFTMGLLAPSILLAIVSKPPDVQKLPGFEEASQIKSLSQALLAPFVGVALADDTLRKQYVPQQIQKSDVVPGVTDGVKAALGLQSVPMEKSIYVVGKTRDLAVAQKNAKEIADLIKGSEIGKENDVNVVKLDGQSTYYVTVGKPVSLKQALNLQNNIRGLAIKSISNENDVAVAKKLGSGGVYNWSDLSK
ncbi:hypothetical protein [Chitinivorax sp. B]|uniref:hypothetical protein n=1 Tax=Chitinivorax sp. B TaxID=2502235 RepID=UPI0010F50541|nr:hypothetical protein [Chitinivorax sp. B]